jgi:hypothetical protein
VLIQHPLWREDGSVIYNCCWLSPARSFSGPRLGTIFYSQIRDVPFCRLLRRAGLRGDIRLRLHTGISSLLYNHFARTWLKIPSPSMTPCFRGVLTSTMHKNGRASTVTCIFISAGKCLPSRCSETAVHAAILKAVVTHCGKASVSIAHSVANIWNFFGLNP